LDLCFDGPDGLFEHQKKRSLPLKALVFQGPVQAKTIDPTRLTYETFGHAAETHALKVIIAA
jgi:hypothetical protein